MEGNRRARRAAPHESFLPNGDRAGEAPLVIPACGDRGLSAESRRGGRVSCVKTLQVLTASNPQDDYSSTVVRRKEARRS